MKALFDFESGGPNELSFVAGEVLTVVEKVCMEHNIIHLCNLCRPLSYSDFSIELKLILIKLHMFLYGASVTRLYFLCKSVFCGILCIVLQNKCDRIFNADSKCMPLSGVCQNISIHASILADSSIL